ncbi:hypothetical protein NDN08_003373 [Rhodosorus marinus]|uniref:Uncharacterized protein n=1 Tax=Rhodosorus marinus TaxID=101924 RepID=A0AAV8UWF4_9RHOD|nr:hypothetical protein NDN08_003373 [Rhodosorus marinus]
MVGFLVPARVWAGGRRDCRASVRPRTSVRVMAQKEYADVTELMTELRSYIDAKERERQEDVAEGLAGAEEEQEDSPIAYAVLAKSGRYDLLDGIMNFGGYVEISKKMGLEIGAEKPIRDPSARPVFKRNSPKDTDGFLTLGGAKAQKLTVEEVETAMNSGSERDALRKVNRERVVTPPSPTPINIKPLIEKGGQDEEVIQLNTAERLTLIAFVILFSLAFGRLGQDFVEAGTRQILKYVIAVSVVLHLGEALYAKQLAEERNRNVFLWCSKVFVLGVGSLLRLKQLKKLPNRKPKTT